MREHSKYLKGEKRLRYREENQEIKLVLVPKTKLKTPVGVAVFGGKSRIGICEVGQCKREVLPLYRGPVGVGGSMAHDAPVRSGAVGDG